MTGTSVAAFSESGWNIFKKTYSRPSAIDGFSFEWQYFMIHDDQNQFTGSIGYVLADPRGRLGNAQPTNAGDELKKRLFPLSLMPSGANVAIAGRWSDGSLFADYQRFSSNYIIGQKSWDFMTQRNTQGYIAQLQEMQPVSAGEGLFQLTGETDSVTWALSVSPDHLFGKSALEFPTMSGNDVGYLPTEHWNVHMEWPRTHVEGTITNKKTQQTYNIEGHGYRENAWGRWNFALDGWAFSIVSDETHRVQWAWQTYHKSKQMDWLDVSFIDQGTTRVRRFFAKNKELKWTLTDWFFDRKARQCVPNAFEIIAQDQDYRIRASYDLTGKQIPMLSTSTPLTNMYVIMIHTPYIKGVIENAKTGEVVTYFEGQGGGEFSTPRSLWKDLSTTDCEQWGQRFNAL
jgi:hypothetical protein